MYLGRRARPGFQAVVALLHARGIEGATVWFPIVDELTAQTGLVTSEIVPSAR